MPVIDRHSVRRRRLEGEQGNVGGTGTVHRTGNVEGGGDPTQVGGVQLEAPVPSAGGTLHAPVGPAKNPALRAHQLQRALETKGGARLLHGVGEASAEWARASLAGSAVIRVFARTPEAPFAVLEAAARKELQRHGLAGHDVSALFARLVEMGVLAETGDRAAPYALAVTKEEAAFQLGDVGALQGALTAALKDVAKDAPQARVRLQSLLLRCARASETWPRYPVEARWPFLKAVALLDKREQSLLSDALASDPQLRHFPLVDTTLLMLSGRPADDWVKQYAPRLAGSAVYTVAAEGWFAAGGLGRVQQYHAAAMKQLVGKEARVVTIEPFYAKTAQGQDIDYGKLPTPVQLGPAPEHVFEVMVDGRMVKAEAWKGTTPEGVEAWLLKDADHRHTKVCYGYNRDGQSCWEDFTEFFSRASAELMRTLEAKEQQTRGASYKPPAIIANDGQAAPVVPFLKEIEKRDPTLKHAATWMVTHTYKNRGVFDGVQQADGLLARWRIHDELRASFWRIGAADVSSGGVRNAHGASGVSAVHVDEVNPIDPKVALVAITNGDNRVASSSVFRGLLPPGADADAPTPAELAVAKRSAKQALGLDPNQPVISYSGRLVDEKAGRQRAFTDDNLRALVKQGAQVVLYGNVQAFAASEAIWRDLQRLADELAKGPGPGRLVLKSGWGVAEQRALLAATDVQVQDSDRGTGAAEYTEADVSANGGLQMGPPWIEGIINRQGVLVDRESPGSGNTLIPADAQPSSYLETLSWAVERFNDGTLSQWQASSVRLSRSLEALLTSSEYLRQLDRVLSLTE
ncbi:MAG: glycogen/starch synthase [Deltaproteobacteria bacterium]|nr:glycogen/starch synthase [Deltaproteobacteria bacterium]